MPSARLVATRPSADSTILVEFMPEGGIRDLADAATIVAGVAAPNVAIMLDTWHFFRTAGELADLEQLPPRSIGAVQVGDAAAAAWATGIDPPSADRLLPGLGAVPVRDIVAIARRNNPDVVVGIEVFNRVSIDTEPDGSSSSGGRRDGRLARALTVRLLDQPSRSASRQTVEGFSSQIVLSAGI